MAWKSKLITSEEWGAKPPKRVFPTKRASNIILHHTGFSPVSGGTEEGAKKLARSIQRDHMDARGWSDSGQNFLISIGGFILEGRHGSVAAAEDGKCVESAHAGVKTDDGKYSPGIEVEGNWMTDTHPAVQWDSVLSLCADLCRLLGLAPSAIVGHRDFSATDCPGDEFYSRIGDVRVAVTELLVLEEALAAAPNTGAGQP